MVIAYDHSNFWGVVFTRVGSSFPRVFPRSVLLLCITSAILVPVGHTQPAALFTMRGIAAPYRTLVAFVIGFRLNSAYGRFQQANDAVLDLHADARKLMERLITYAVEGSDVDDALEKIRRYLVLTCVLMKKHVRVENDFTAELKCGLLQHEEHTRLTKEVASAATRPGGDGKSDRFPSRNRTAFSMQLLRREIHSLLLSKKLTASPPQGNSVDGLLDHLSDIFERVELIGLNVAPLPYTQVSSCVCVIFLMSLGFDMYGAHYEASAVDNYRKNDYWAAHLQIDFVVAIICFTANMLFFAINDVATQLESPFGRGRNAVEFEKMLRRIDKHTAAQLSLRLGNAVAHFDLYPEQRTTSVSHWHRHRDSHAEIDEIFNAHELHIALETRKIERKAAQKMTEMVDAMGAEAVAVANLGRKQIRSLTTGSMSHLSHARHSVGQPGADVVSATALNTWEHTPP